MICNEQFQLKKDGSPKKRSYCAHPELIENYDLAMADKERTWICHHKKEEFYTQPELVDLGLYYNVSPEDLVFVRDNKEHKSWPHKGNINISKARKGIRHSEEHIRKLSENSPRKIKVKCVETGRIFESIKAATIACGLKDGNSIRVSFKDPNKTAAGYHWSIV